MEPAVRHEMFVFGGHDGLAQDDRNLVVADDLPALAGELADYRAVTSDDARDDTRRVVVECLDLGQVAGKGEEHAASRACRRDGHEQHDNAKAAQEPREEIHEGTLYLRRGYDGYDRSRVRPVRQATGTC